MEELRIGLVGTGAIGRTTLNASTTPAGRKGSRMRGRKR